jgi:hypothetical protein
MNEGGVLASPAPPPPQATKTVLTISPTIELRSIQISYIGG